MIRDGPTTVSYDLLISDSPLSNGATQRRYRRLHILELRQGRATTEVTQCPAAVLHQEGLSVRVVHDGDQVDQSARF